MTSSQKKRSFVVLTCILIAFVVLAPNLIKDSLPDSWPSKPIRLGLDLRGGTYLVLEVQTEEAVKSRLRSIASELKSAMRKEKIRLKSKVDGTRELVVRLIRERGRAEVEEYVRAEFTNLALVPESGDPKELRYRMKDARADEIKKTSVEQAIETIRNRVDGFGVAEPTIQRSQENRIVVQLPDVTDIETVKRTIGKLARLEFRLVAQGGAAEKEETVKRRQRRGGEIELEDEVIMTGDVIDRAYVSINPQSNEAEVALNLNSIGARVFERATSQYTGRDMAIVLDDVVQSAPRIRERIAGGHAVISGGFTAEEAHLLAIVLRAGALPAPLIFKEERTVGSTLGADSIRQGLTSLALGSFLVLLFTIVYYKKSGVLAVGCLVLNLVFLLGLLALFQATLTLPGIAGLVLTVGMAVDANVIIFERIREEIRAGSTPRAAVEGGFLKAHWTILDANITTFLTGVILYGFGSGPIRGFAVTLCLGIVTSVFTALFVAKLGFDILNLRRSDDQLSI
ncbi:MAG: protein translocase subunit SecD [Bdellovibrionales bacterium]|nr:protein translocase subunit SecD [Bdellovibrionales bacterium]